MTSCRSVLECKNRKDRPHSIRIVNNNANDNPQRISTRFFVIFFRNRSCNNN